jgi:hypothetical protein
MITPVSRRSKKENIGPLQRAEHPARDERLRRRDRRVPSPIIARAMSPPLITISGFTPKNTGFHRTRSAIWPTSAEPTS